MSSDASFQDQLAERREKLRQQELERISLQDEELARSLWKQEEQGFLKEDALLAERLSSPSSYRRPPQPRRLSNSDPVDDYSFPDFPVIPRSTSRNRQRNPQPLSNPAASPGQIPLSTLFSLLGPRRGAGLDSQAFFMGPVFGMNPMDSYERLVNLPVVPTPAKNKEDLPVMEITDDKEFKGESCTICLSEFECGHKIKTLPCTHRYHCECIDKWLETQNKCPICKHPVDF